MRIYFLSCEPAVLKLNGEYAGGVDLFERYVELNLRDNVLAEIVPGGEYLPVNFFVDEKLIASPPEFLEVYLGENEAAVWVKRFERRNFKIEVRLQLKFAGNLITVFSHGGTYLSVDGAGTKLYPLPDNFVSPAAKEQTLGGFPVLEIRSQSELILLSASGEMIFCNTVISAEIKNTLQVLLPFETCTAAYAVCEYVYNGQSLNLVKSRTEERETPPESVLHFAFFESLLFRGDYKKYLSTDMQQNAGRLYDYLGAFEGVVVPFEGFERAHAGLLAAGLVYRKSQNLFEIKYYAVELKEGKIDNVFAVN